MSNKHLILDEADIRQRTIRMAFQIVERNHLAKELVLIGVEKRGRIFADLLAKQISEITKAKIVQGSLVLDKSDPLAHPISLSLAEEALIHRTVILVDDVANTGKTTFYGMKPLMEIPLAKLQIAVLVDRQHKSFPVSPDYVGMSLSTTINEHISVEFGKQPAAYLN